MITPFVLSEPYEKKIPDLDLEIKQPTKVSWRKSQKLEIPSHSADLKRCLDPHKSVFGFDVTELVHTMSDEYIGYPLDFLNYETDDILFESDKLFGFPDWPETDVCGFSILRNGAFF